tara:strand:- start:320 stop:436 length:117 start_codon:yes stop_codon:yes gene_type:complete
VEEALQNKDLPSKEQWQQEYDYHVMQGTRNIIDKKWRV